MFLSRFRNTSESLEEREILWEHQPTGKCFHSCFEFSQTSMSLSIKQLDYELEISVV